MTKQERKQKNKELIKRTKQATLGMNIPKSTQKNTMATNMALLERASSIVLPMKEDEICITGENELKEYMLACIDNGVDAIDCESDGTLFTDTLAGICLYTPDMNPAYIPINHRDIKTGKLLGNQLSFQFVKEQFARLQGNKHIYHTAKFENKQFLYNFGYELKAFWDCYLAEFFITQGDRKGLKYLYSRDIMGDMVNKGKSYKDIFYNLPFTYVPLDVATIYAGGDAYKTYKVFEHQYNKLKKPENKGVYNVYKHIENNLISVTTNMEFEGVNLDLELNKELSIEYNEKLEQLKQEILDITREYNVLDVNLNSPIQLADLLYDTMKLLNVNPAIVDKKGVPKRPTGVEVLSNIKHPIGKLLLDYRGIEKLIGTYIDKFPKELNKYTNKIHAQFGQLGTDTGRYNSKKPNMQNIPSKNKDIRRMFVPPEGYVWIGADYSKQEPAILAQMSMEETMLDAYRTGKDVYVQLATKLFNVPEDACKEFNPDGSKNPEGAKRRSQAKKILLGILYGMGAKKLAVEMDMDVMEAKKIITDFKSAYKRIDQFCKDSLEMARDMGYVTTACGRRRYLPDVQLEPYEILGNIQQHDADRIADKIEELRWEFDKKKQFIRNMEKKYNIRIKDNNGYIAQAERQAVNSRIQGSAADVTKLAMIKIHNDKELKELGFKMVLSIHDEIVGIAPYENRHRCAELVKQCMVDAPKKLLPDVTFKIDVEVTDRWYGEEIE